MGPFMLYACFLVFSHMVIPPSNEPEYGRRSLKIVCSRLRPSLYGIRLAPKALSY